jgi:uncharacterized protein (DUF305 family)
MKTITLICVGIILGLSSCKNKKEDAIVISPPTQPGHTENKMMNEVHTMMNIMDTMNMSGDPDTHFAKMMKMHHQGAINMSNIVLSEGKDTTIKRIAQSMKMMQMAEITNLNNFLSAHIPHAANMTFNDKMKLSMEKMHRNADLQNVNGNIDHDFAILMIFHHQSAIEMADLVIHFGHETTISNMAQSMKTDQEMEIEELQKWLLK